jgi:hypothetical protein
VFSDGDSEFVDENNVSDNTAAFFGEDIADIAVTDSALATNDKENSKAHLTVIFIQ